MNFTRVEEMLVRDVSLSYKLLIFVNKQVKSNAKPIASFKQAAVYLGEEQLRKFISLVATSLSNNTKPSELYLMSVIRARFCELVIKETAPNYLPQEAFLAGLFSLLDSLLDQPLGLLISQIQLNDRIKSALIDGQGPFALCLACIKHFEVGSWQNINDDALLLNTSPEKLAPIYLESLSWAKKFNLSST